MLTRAASAFVIGLVMTAPACVGAEPPPDAGTTMKSDAITLSGTLHVRREHGRKSVDDYLYTDLTVTTATGEKHALVPSAKVTREALLALDGKAVTLEVIKREAPAPSPMEQHPIGPDGAALPRAPRFEVMGIR